MDLLAPGLAIPCDPQVSNDAGVLKENTMQNALNAFCLVSMVHGHPHAILFTPASAHGERPLLPSDGTAVLNIHFSPCGTRLVTSRYLKSTCHHQ